MMRRIMLGLLLGCAATALAAQTATVTPLSAAGIPALLKPPAHGERIIMLWALDCVYCESNMQALARLQRAHPKQIALVTVSTDDIAQHQAIAARLEAAGMQGYPARAYTEPTPARLNFLIDPDWGGETPRTLVIRSNGTRIAISGALTPSQLRQLQP